MNKHVAWAMLITGTLGLAITFPLWLTNNISDRAMLGITLALSWGALIFEGFNAIGIHKNTKDG